MIYRILQDFLTLIFTDAHWFFAFDRIYGILQDFLGKARGMINVGCWMLDVEFWMLDEWGGLTEIEGSYLFWIREKRTILKGGAAPLNPRHLASHLWARGIFMAFKDSYNDDGKIRGLMI